MFTFISILGVANIAAISVNMIYCFSQREVRIYIPQNDNTKRSKKQFKGDDFIYLLHVTTSFIHYTNVVHNSR